MLPGLDAGALCDRRAVKHYRFAVMIAVRRFCAASLFQPDVQLGKRIVRRKIQHIIHGLARRVAGIHNAFIFGLRIHRRNICAQIKLPSADLFVQIKPARPADGHVRHTAKTGIDRLYGDVGRVRTQTNATAGGVAAKLPHPLIHLPCNIPRHSCVAFLCFHKTVTHKCVRLGVCPSNVVLGQVSLNGKIAIDFCNGSYASPLP